MNRLTTSRGEFGLTRFPEDPRDQLRAWDAADEYLLRHLEGIDGEPIGLTGTVVVLGDRWGALVTALSDHRPVQITDSYLTQQATRANLSRNEIDQDAVRLCTTMDPPPPRIDVLLIRVPKALSLLEDQLHCLAPHVHAGTVIVGAGMVTEIHTSTLQLFERILGPTKTSLAVKKARLIFCSPDSRMPRHASPWPRKYTLPTGIGAVSGLTVINHAGTFCADRLDIGTRFFLENLPPLRGREHVVDLGCGNGVIGLAASLTDGQAKVSFIDESYQALASAEATVRANTDMGGTATFVAADGMSGVPAGTVDLILTNPPFHTHRARTDATAWRMFNGSRAALRRGGELWVVANRHLGYHVKLRRLFGNCEIAASNPKFVVLRAVKR
ncbi:methyltransferase [Nonomuraea sp. NPDC049695]|uniref:methyltransferase n=1 Tax=Nonomuraea sp. NPDC049695 TaxID=3154734 RepID=UPI003433F1AC